MAVSDAMKIDQKIRHSSPKFQLEYPSLLSHSPWLVSPSGEAIAKRPVQRMHFHSVVRWSSRKAICVQRGGARRRGGKGKGGGRCTRAAIVRLVTREACTRYFWEVNGPDYEVQVLRSVTVPVIPWVVDVTFVLLKISSSTFFPYFSIRPGEVDACLLRNFLSEWTLLFRSIQLPLTNFDRNWISSRSFYPSSNII